MIDQRAVIAENLSGNHFGDIDNGAFALIRIDDAAIQRSQSTAQQRCGTDQAEPAFSGKTIFRLGKLSGNRSEIAA